MDRIGLIARLTGKSRDAVVKHEAYQASQRAAWASNKHDRRDRGMVRTMNALMTARGIPGSIAVEEWQAICAAYNYTCPHCGEQKPLTMDHIRPTSRGGSHSADNIQPLCKPCNSRKGAREAE